MSTPRPPISLLIRTLIGFALVCGGAVALVGGLYLRGSGLIAVGVSAALVACLAAGIARETQGAGRTAPLEAAVQAGGLTVVALLVLSGTAVVSSGAAAVVLGAVGVGVALVVVARHGRSAQRQAGAPAAPRGTAVAAVPVPLDIDHGGPVLALTTRALGREWLRMTGMLAAALLPSDRAALVRRRQEALDELELRDPEGFRRWLAVGGPQTDPSDYVHGERTAGTDAA